MVMKKIIRIARVYVVMADVVAGQNKIINAIAAVNTTYMANETKW